MLRTVFFACAFCLLALMSCKTAKQTQNEDGTVSITAKESKSFDIEMKANYTTGYSWHIDSTQWDTTIVMLEKKDYKQSGAEEGAIGAGGKEVWTFKGLKAGKCDLVFTYARANKPDDGVKQTYHIVIE